MSINEKVKELFEYNSSGDKTYIITCRDNENNLFKLLNAIKTIGNVGHSFTIVVDPGPEQQKFSWDGDGSDSIRDIKIK